MAPLSNYISILFLATLVLPLQINARDSQFFSKVTHVNNNNINNDAKETELPNKEGPGNKPEQQPVFIPETGKNYGLYGHESPHFPSTTTTTTTTNDDPFAGTTTYQPYKTEFEDTSKYPNKKYYNKDAYKTDRYSNNYYNKDAYVGNYNELSDTKYTEGGYNPMENQNNNQKYYYNNDAANDRYYYNNNAANDRYSYNNNAANNRYNAERQGMSDTRFLEGGKYFYDLEYEKYNPTLYGDSSRGVNTKNWYNNRGYFAKNNGHGNNNANYYKNKNSKEGYQNQDEFEDDQDDFDP